MSGSSSPYGADLGLHFGEDLEEEDFCRGYGAQTNQLTDIDEDFFQNDSSNNDDSAIKAPSMPQDFYQGVEEFLSKGPPVLKETGGHARKKKAKAKPKTEKVESIKPSLPKIPSASSANEMGQMQPVNKVVKPKKIKAAANTVGAIKREVDQTLLKEAFAYTDQLLKQALLDEQANAVAAEAVHNGRSVNSKSNPKGGHGRHSDSDSGISSIPYQQPYDALQQQRQKKSKPQRSASVDANSAYAEPMVGVGADGVAARPPKHSSASSIYGNASTYAAAGIGAGTGAGAGAARKGGSSKAGGSSAGMVKKLRSRTEIAGSSGGGRGKSGGTRTIRSGGGNGVGGQGTIMRSNTADGATASGGFHVMEVQEKDSRRNAVDFDQLVANFQDGITMQKLKQELEASKKSMAKSEQYIKSLSREYYS